MARKQQGIGSSDESEADASRVGHNADGSLLVAVSSAAGPSSMASAPKSAGRTILLYCREQGGWHTGKWFKRAWFDSATLTKKLTPSHWREAPGEPD